MIKSSNCKSPRFLGWQTFQSRLGLSFFVSVLFGTSMGLAQQQPVASEVSLPPEIVSLKKAILSLSWQVFVRELVDATAHPDPNNQEPLPVVSLSDVGFPPDIDVNISRTDLLRLFIQQEIKLLGAKISDEKKFIDQMSYSFSGYDNGTPYAMVTYLDRVTIPMSAPTKLVSPKESISITAVSLPAAFPKNHTMNMGSRDGLMTYVRQRFPQPLLDFLRQQKATLFLDDDNCTHALQLQSRQGFTEAFRYMGSGDSEESAILVTRNPKYNRFRLLICSLAGRDDLERARVIFGTELSPARALFASHHPKDSILQLNREKWGEMKVDSKQDLVVAGYQGTIWRHLSHDGQDSSWNRVSLVDHGPGVFKFFNSTTGQTIISIQNLYGDQTTQAMQVFYDKGFRRFIYLGTAGGLGWYNARSNTCSQFNIGDIFLPDSFADRNQRRFNFKNSASDWSIEPPELSPTAPPNIERARVFDGGLQGWVPDLIVETETLLTRFRDSGIRADDVESQYFAGFVNSHPDITEHAVFIFISDKPPLPGCGVIDPSDSYANEQAHHEVLKSSVDSVADHIFKFHDQH